MYSYRVKAQEACRSSFGIKTPWSSRCLRWGRQVPEPELDRLSSIVHTFNELFGNIGWKDADKIGKVIAEEIPAKVAADKAYQNAMKNSDKQNARIEHDNALQRVVVELLKDHTELYKQFTANSSFQKWLGDSVFSATYHPPAA
jgi:type I restriction enzyme, R subunit